MTSAHRARHAAEGLFALKERAGVGLCGVKGCRKACHPQKVGLCHQHHQQRWRMKSPKRSAYTALRDHAKERGIAFTISYEYWQGLTDALGYWAGDGVPTIDRVRAERGYEPGNLTVISLAENTAKGNRERHLPAVVQALLERKRRRMSGSEVANPFERDPDECPF